MATKDITSITIEDTGGGSGVTITGDDFEPFEPANEEPAIATGKGYQRGYGFRTTMTIPVLRVGDGANWAVYGAQDLYAAMIANTEKKITLTYEDATTYAYDPVLVQIVPYVLGRDMAGASFWIKASPIGTPPTSYTDLGAFAAGTAPEFSIRGENDHRSRQRFAKMTCTWTVNLYGEVSTTLDALTDEVAIAVALGRGTEDYFELDDLKVRNAPGHSSEERVTRAVFEGAWVDPRGDTMIVMPASPEEVIFGTMMTFMAGGTTKGYLTIT